MTDTVTGLVKKLTSKPAGKSGSLVYNICLTCDDNGEDEWFGHGWDVPIFFEGDEVSFNVIMKGEYANVDVGSVAIIAEGPGAPEEVAKPAGRRGAAPAARGRSAAAAPSRRGAAPAAKPAGRKQSSASGNSKDQYWEDKAKYDKKKDIIIQLQSAQNTAIATIVGALQADGIALPTKKSDKLDAFIALIDEEAARLRNKYLEELEDKPSRAAANTEPEYDDTDDIPE